MATSPVFPEFEVIDYGRHEAGPAAIPAAIPAGRPSAIRGALRRLLGAARAWNDRRVTRKVLAGLDDHLLDDIGLSRADAGGLPYRLSDCWWWRRP